jgi:23S rRNA pseudouridine1911/1915/1917 synthase
MSDPVTTAQPLPDITEPGDLENISLSVESTGRLDAILSGQIAYFSRSRLQKLISEGQVKVNETIVTDKKTQVKRNDFIEITVPPAEPMILPAEDIPLDILYEDRHLIVINKPAGMVVHPAPGHSSGTLVNALLFHCAAQGETLPGINGIQRPGIVHRLDKDTTGAIVVAKTEQALQHLQAQFKTKTARRSYHGIVYGAPKEDSGTVNAPIGRHPTERQKQAIVPEESGGRPAITHWNVQERLGYFTSLEYELETGRTHQIRVHTTHMGYPIVGDPLYGSGKNLVKVNLTGQALHAWRLRLIHPATEELIETIAPIPKAMETLAEVLRKRARS